MTTTTTSATEALLSRARITENTSSRFFAWVKPERATAKQSEYSVRRGPDGRWTCSCPASAYHHGPCKHVRALRAWWEAEHEGTAAATPPVRTASRAPVLDRSSEPTRWCGWCMEPVRGSACSTCGAWYEA